MKENNLKATDLTQEIQARVSEAITRCQTLNIVSGGSKSFYGREPMGEPLLVSGHQGIIEYEPGELVLTARCGTPLAELESLLADEGQMLPFEPPHFGAATLGGAVASGLSGPRRPFTGAVRDFVLGVKMVTGRGEVLAFGGRVMKNVAGYDLSRLLAGSLGTMGVLLEISLKVLPRPALEVTVRREISSSSALESMATLMSRSLPLSGLCYQEPFLYVRVAGTENAVAAAIETIDGEAWEEGECFWQDLREQRLPFFTEGTANLWRLSQAPSTPVPDFDGEWLLDWGGAQRWLRSHAPAEQLFDYAAQVGGHATLFRTQSPRHRIFQPLPPALARLHRTLKASFDPHGIFNPGRMYEEF